MTTTTQHMQSGPDYYSSGEECKHIRRENTNPRYSSFQQTHFTAGDEEQFIKYKNEQGFETSIPSPSPSSPSLSLSYDSRYSNINGVSIYNTFRYMFHKFKKGVFIQIQDRHVSVMMPFSKHNYTNEWSDRIDIDPNKYSTMNDVFERVYSIDKQTYKNKRVNQYKDQWYANNGVFRYEYPLRENDSGIHMINDMFHTLCERYDIPNIEFFINKRDHPILKKDGTEPYDVLFGDHHPLVSHDYTHYAPVLSMCSGESFSDIPIPTWDDWARVCADENKYFPKCAHYYPSNIHHNPTEWNDKIPTAIFRGSSTGFGLTENDNMRIKVAMMSLARVCDEYDTTPYIDAGITSWNVRPRIQKETGYVDTFDDRILELPLLSYMTLEEQSRYKYILHIDGHTSAYRLSRELGSGSVILYVQSRFKLWFFDQLVPYVHYIPVAEDLSDLYKQIQWCRLHDEECQRITQNALEFYNTTLQKEGILKYLRNTIVTLAHQLGIYEYAPSVHEYIVKQIPAPSPPSLSSLPSFSSFVHVNSKTRIQIEDQIRMKQSSNYNELVNEAMIGTHCINPLLSHIPNFIHTIGLSTDTSKTPALPTLYTRFIPEIFTLDKYLTHSSFNMSTYIHILFEISCALHVAQEQCLFIHNDMYAWNILLVESDSDAYYMTHAPDTIYIRTRCKYRPVLIDYGKSKAVVDGMCVGIIHPFGSDRIHDICTLLISSLYIIIHKRTLSKADTRKVFQLFEFFNGTGYTSYKTIHTFRELKHFLAIRKKYASMIDTPKAELADKTPLDFIRFLTSQFHIRHDQVFYNPLRSSSSSPPSIPSIDYIYHPVQRFTEIDLNDPSLRERLYDYYTTHQPNLTLDVLHLRQECIDYVNNHQDKIETYKDILALDIVHLLDFTSIRNTFLGYYETHFYPK